MALKGLKYQGNCSTGMKIPDKKICGEIKTGMNWIIWNSFLANVEINIPKETEVIVRMINIMYASIILPE